jgi:hypothetical protein
VAFEKIAQYLGLSGPLVAAGLIYALFRFFDKKASDAANQAVTAWIKGEQYRRLDLKSAVVEAFDHLYGTPLFRMRSFLRSAGVSLLAVFAWVIFLVFSPVYVGGDDPSVFLLHFIEMCLIYAIPTIIFDYGSLFVVRRIVAIDSLNVKITILLVLISIFVAIVIVTIAIIEWITYIAHLLSPTENVALLWPPEPVWLLVAAPALLVHLWLPLLLLSAALTAALTAFFRAVGLAQWFIRHGDNHPLDAIGMVATAVVFVGAAAWQGISYLVLR